MRILQLISCACAGFLIASSSAVAQRRAAPLQRPTVGVAIALKAGGEPYQFTGQASCTHAPVASIYGLMAEQWSVEQSDGRRSLTLTVWKPRNGSNTMMSMAVSAGNGSHLVNTVKATGSPQTQGSGTVSFAPAGSGGTFTVDAKSANGTALAGTIKCDAFSTAVAEGGN